MLYGSWLLAGLVYYGYYAIAPDMPGCGASILEDHVNHGRPFKTRSNFNDVTNGPIDVVVALIKALKYKKAILVGYDWGAGIALSAAVNPRARRFVSKIVAWHPSYNEKVKDELCLIRAPSLIIWVKEDQFHNWNRWKFRRNIPSF